MTLSRRNRMYLFFAVVVLVLLCPLVIRSEFYLHLMIMIFMNLVLAVSWNIIFQTGQVPLSHAAFMAIGAYTSTLFVMRLNVPFLLAFIMAGIMAFVIAILFGLLVLRLKGVYFVLFTFIFGEIVRLILVNSVETFGGASGISNIPFPSIFGFQVNSKMSFYYLFLVLAILTVAVAYRFQYSRIGRVFSGIKNNEMLSLAVGIDTKYYKVLSFAVGSLFAGLSGSLYAHYFTHISPHSFTFVRSFDIIIFNIVGGTGNVFGPILGSIIFTPLPELFRSAQQYQVLIYAVCLMLSVLFLRDGLLSIADFFKPKQKTVMVPKEVNQDNDSNV